MKKIITILIFIGIMGHITYTPKVKAITSYDEEFYEQYVDPYENKIRFSINVDGLVEGSNQTILIRGIHHLLENQNKKSVTKYELLDAVKHQMNVLHLDDEYELIDFASDAQLFNKDRQLLFANSDSEGTVTLEDDIQQYLLKGHVILRKRIEEPIINPAETVNIHYTVQFYSPDNNLQFLPIHRECGEKFIGEYLNSNDFRQLAEKILHEASPEYTIIKKDYSTITHNVLGNLPRHTAYHDYFNYEIKNRQRLMAKDPKSGKELGETQSVDSIFEKYIISKRTP